MQRCQKCAVLYTHRAYRLQPGTSYETAERRRGCSTRALKPDPRDPDLRSGSMWSRVRFAVNNHVRSGLTLQLARVEAKHGLLRSALDPDPGPRVDRAPHGQRPHFCRAKSNSKRHRCTRDTHSVTHAPL